ncbi:MAG TPA: response regulator transcription factor [Dehalococcoidia bacterium]
MRAARILVAEPDPDLQLLLRFLFEREGYRATCVFDGENALRMWQAEPPDLVLLDASLPTLAGLDALRSMCKNTSTPVVVLSASGTGVDIGRGLGLGAAAYLTKPLPPRRLLAVVQSLLRQDRVSPGLVTGGAPNAVLVAISPSA